MREKKTITRPQNAFVGDEKAIYLIRVKGLLDERWSDFLSGFSITHHPDEISVLVGEVRDQADLFGILIKIRDLAIPLIAIEQLEKVHNLGPKSGTRTQKRFSFYAMVDKIKQISAIKNDDH
jgi:hypothetical protein